jgi:hypothetical protein
MKTLWMMTAAVFFLHSNVSQAWGSRKPQERGSEQRGDSTLKSTPPPPAVPGQYLISFEASVSDASRSSIFKKWAVTELDKVGSTPLYLIEVPEGKDTDKIISGLRSSPGVRYIEPNFTMSIFEP